MNQLLLLSFRKNNLFGVQFVLNEKILQTPRVIKKKKNTLSSNIYHIIQVFLWIFKSREVGNKDSRTGERKKKKINNYLPRKILGECKEIVIKPRR